MKPKYTNKNDKEEASRGIIKRLLKEAYYNTNIPDNLEIDVERFFAVPVPLQGGMERKIQEYDIQWDKPRNDVVNFKKVSKEELEEIKKEKARTPRQRTTKEVFHVLEKEDPKKHFKLNDSFDYLLMEVIKKRIPTRKVLKDVNGDIVVYTLPEATGKKSKVSSWSSQGMDESEKNIHEIIEKINPILNTAYFIKEAFRNKSDAYTLVIKNRTISEVTGQYDTRESYLNFEEAYKNNEAMFKMKRELHGQRGDEDDDFVKGVAVDGPLWQKIDLSESIKKTIKESVANKVRYTGVVVRNEKDINTLENILNDNLQKLNIKKSDWIVPENYHMTITLGKLPLFLIMRNDLGKEVDLYIDAIGVSDEAIAFRCSGYMSRNDTQHITMLFKTSPSASKDIENWIKIDEPFYVSGTIEEVE